MIQCPICNCVFERKGLYRTHRISLHQAEVNLGGGYVAKRNFRGWFPCPFPGCNMECAIPRLIRAHFYETHAECYDVPEEVSFLESCRLKFTPSVQLVVCMPCGYVMEVRTVHHHLQVVHKKVVCKEMLAKAFRTKPSQIDHEARRRIMDGSFELSTPLKGLRIHKGWWRCRLCAPKGEFHRILDEVEEHFREVHPHRRTSMRHDIDRVAVQSLQPIRFHYFGVIPPEESEPLPETPPPTRLLNTFPALTIARSSDNLKSRKWVARLRRRPKEAYEVQGPVSEIQPSLTVSTHAQARRQSLVIRSPQSVPKLQPTSPVPHKKQPQTPSNPQQVRKQMARDTELKEKEVNDVESTPTKVLAGGEDVQFLLAVTEVYMEEAHEVLCRASHSLLDALSDVGDTSLQRSFDGGPRRFRPMENVRSRTAYTLFAARFAAFLIDAMNEEDMENFRAYALAASSLRSCSVRKVDMCEMLQRLHALFISVFAVEYDDAVDKTMVPICRYLRTYFAETTDRVQDVPELVYLLRCTILSEVYSLASQPRTGCRNKDTDSVLSINSLLRFVQRTANVPYDLVLTSREQFVQAASESRDDAEMRETSS